jgi:hypothetical protein
LSKRRSVSKRKEQAMNERTDHIEEDEISDEAVETAGTRTEVAGAWTILCTSGIQCNYVFE